MIRKSLKQLLSVWPKENSGMTGGWAVNKVIGVFGESSFCGVVGIMNNRQWTRTYCNEKKHEFPKQAGKEKRALKSKMAKGGGSRGG